MEQNERMWTWRNMIYTKLCTKKPQPSAYNQENDFCLTTRSDLILKPLTTNPCFSLGCITVNGLLSSYSMTRPPPPHSCTRRCKNCFNFRIKTICWKFIFTFNCSPLGSIAGLSGSGCKREPNKFLTIFHSSLKGSVIKNLGWNVE